jgi:hypothetical protein
MDTRFWVVTLTPLLALLNYVFLLFMTLRRGAHFRLHRLFTLYVLIMAVWSLGSSMMRLDPVRILLWNKVTTGSAMIMPVAFLGFVQTFLDEREDSWLGASLLIVVGLEVVNGLGLILGDIRLLEGGLLSFDVGPITYPMATFNGLVMVFSLGRLARAHQRVSDPVLRNRVRYPLIGGGTVLLGGLSNLLDVPAHYPIEHAANLINASLLAYSVFRYQLLDIRVVIRKGLVHLVPTAVIGTIYFLLTFLAVRLFHAFAGPQVFLLSLLVAATTAVAIQPLQAWAQDWIDKLLFRERHDANLMLQKLSCSAASMLDLDQLSDMVLHEITATMRIRTAVFFLRQKGNGEFLLTAQRGADQLAGAGLRNDSPVATWLSQHQGTLTWHNVEVIPQFKALWEQKRKDLEGWERSC